MTQHELAEVRAYSDDNSVPVTALAKKIAKELDFEIKASSDHAFSFKGLDDHAGPFTAYVASKGDQCYADLGEEVEQTSDELENGKTVTTEEQAIEWLREVFAEAQAEDVPL